MKIAVSSGLVVAALLSGVVTAGAQGVIHETTTTTTRTRTIAPEVRTRVREYVTTHRHPSYHWNRRIAVGEVLPPEVDFYRVEGIEDAPYEYAYVDDEPVLVEPGTRRVIEILR